jgi:hypothetical protein
VTMHLFGRTTWDVDMSHKLGLSPDREFPTQIKYSAKGIDVSVRSWPY